MDENLFKHANEAMVRAICQKNYTLWKPNASQPSSNHLQLLSLVRKDRYGGYTPLEYKLPHVLKDESLDEVDYTPEIDVGPHEKTTFVKVKGNVDSKFAGCFGLNFSGAAGVYVESSLGELYKREVEKNSLGKLLQFKKIDLDHDVIHELMGKKKAVLCVVTGVIKTRSNPPPVLSASIKFKAGVEAKAQLMEQGFSADVNVASHTKKTHGVPENSVLAFKVAELSVDVNTKRARMMIIGEGKATFGCFGTKYIKEMLKEMFRSKGGFFDGGVRVGMAADDLVGDDLKESSLVLDPHPEAIKSLTAAFADVSSKEKREFVGLFLELCSESQLLVKLLESLESGKTSTENEIVDNILVTTRKYKIGQYVQTLCESLAVLDDQALCSLSTLEVSELPVLQEFVAHAFESSTGFLIPYTDPKIQRLMVDEQLRDVLIVGFNYSLSSDGLTPPYNYPFVESTHIALKILKSIL